MRLTELLDEKLILDIGRVAVLRGQLRFNLKSAGDALLASRLGDQGIARIMLAEKELEPLCKVLLQLGEIRGVEPEALEELERIREECASDFELASAIPNGSWTCLGEFGETRYGLYLGENVIDGNFLPNWLHLTVKDLASLVERLEATVDSLNTFVWACRRVADLGKTGNAPGEEIDPSDEKGGSETDEG